MGTIQKNQRFHSSTQSEQNRFADGTEPFSKTTTGLSYAYHKTDAADADHWSLHISRSHTQWGTELAEQTLAWSWWKTGWLSESGEHRWSEGLSAPGVISAHPDAVAAQELRYSDELAAELLQLLEQTTESTDSDLSHRSYQQKLTAILEQAHRLLDGEAAIQLQAQRPDLLALGQIAQEWHCHELLDPLVGGLFSEALAVQSSWEAKLFGIDFKWFVQAGSQTTSVPSLLFPAKLVAAARMQPDLAEHLQDPAWVKALVELGRAYAALDPVVDPTEPALNFFLDTLWQAQEQAAMAKGANEFKAFLKCADSSSLHLLQFTTHLLKAVKSATALQAQVHAPKLLSSLVQLGGTYANSTPAATTDGQGEPLIPFLELAWNAQNETQTDATVEALQTLVQGFANPSEVLKFSHTILQIADTPGDLRPKQLPRLPQVDPTLTISTPPGNPFYRLFGIFPGDPPRFIQHYYEGGGAPVDLADWGLLETYRNAPDVRRGASKLKYDAINEVKRQASMGAPTQVTGELTEGVDATFVIFSMGGSVLELEYIARIDRSKPHVGRYTSHPDYVSYPYILELRYLVNDRFDDALDVFDLIEEEQELPGNPIPYPLRASWTIIETGWTSPMFD